MFAGKWARWGFERGLHVSQEDCRRDGPHGYDVVTNDAALVNSIEDRLMSLKGCIKTLPACCPAYQFYADS